MDCICVSLEVWGWAWILIGKKLYWENQPSGWLKVQGLLYDSGMFLVWLWMYCMLWAISSPNWATRARSEERSAAKVNILVWTKAGFCCYFFLWNKTFFDFKDPFRNKESSSRISVFEESWKDTFCNVRCEAFPVSLSELEDYPMKWDTREYS